MVAVAAVVATGCAGSASTSARDTPPSTVTTRRPPSTTAAVAPTRIVVRRRATLPHGSARAVLVAGPTGLLLLGGLDASRNTTGEILRIDPATGTVTNAGTLAVAVHDAAAADVGGGPTVFGGGNANETASVQRVGTDGTTTVIGRLPVPRSDLSAATVAGRVYLVGGYDGTRVRATTLSTADAAAFQILGDLPVPVRYAAVGALGHDVYVVGGTTTGSAGGAVAAVQALDTTTGAVRSVGVLPFPLTDAVAATLHGHLYVLGGLVDGRPSARIWRLDPPSGTTPLAFVPVATLPVPLADAAVAIDRGIAYVAGGESPALSSAVFSVEAR